MSLYGAATYVSSMRNTVGQMKKMVMTTHLPLVPRGNAKLRNTLNQWGRCLTVWAITTVGSPGAARSLWHLRVWFLKPLGENFRSH